MPNCIFNYVNIRGGVENTRLEAKVKDTKNLRPRTVFPRTDPLEAKDRNAGGQGPRTQSGSDLKKNGLRSKNS